MKTAPGPKELALREMRARRSAKPKFEIKRTAKRKPSNKELRHHG